MLKRLLFLFLTVTPTGRNYSHTQLDYSRNLWLVIYNHCEKAIHCLIFTFSLCCSFAGERLPVRDQRQWQDGWYGVLQTGKISNRFIDGEIVLRNGLRRTRQRLNAHGISVSASDGRAEFLSRLALHRRLDVKNENGRASNCFWKTAAFSFSARTLLTKLRFFNLIQPKCA